MGYYIPKPGTPFTQALTGTAAALTGVRCVQLLVQADPDNTESVFLGDAAAQTIQLIPNSSITLPCGNSALIYAKAASSAANINVWPLL